MKWRGAIRKLNRQLGGDSFAPLTHYRGRFDDYAREVLNRTPTPVQSEIARLMDEPPYRVLVPSANNVGKSALAAMLANYNYDTRSPSVTLITAPKLEQITNGIFREIRDMRPSQAGLAPAAPILRTTFSHIVRGTTASNPDAFQGVHGVDQLMIFDEATGVRRDFIQRAETMFQGLPGYGWVMFYNPNDPSSYVNELEDNGDWHVIRLCALDHPNIVAELRGEEPPIPTAVRLNRIYARLIKECSLVTEGIDPDTDFEFPRGSGYWWKPKTIEFEAQILGRWPLLPTSSLLTPLQIDQVLVTTLDFNIKQPLVISCDVARFGSDKTAIVVRRGQCVIWSELHSKRDNVFIVERLRELVKEYKRQDEKVTDVTIVVDDTGGYGGAVVDFMKDHTVIGVNFSSKSLNPRYKRIRSHLWFTLSECVSEKIIDCSRMPHEHRNILKRDLAAPRYRIDEDGCKVLEPKVQTKSRRGCSPDLADAMALSMYPLIAI